MKVVLFCGGMGLRLRDHENLPKPLARIGDQPILWHLMNYYAHFGHRDFVLCLGYRGVEIKQFFLNYKEALSNDFVLAKGGREITLLDQDIDDWTITFVDTGLNANIGQRLKAVEPYLEGEEVFLANYADGVSDLPLDRYLEHFLASDRVGIFVSVPPQAAFHLVEADERDLVREIRHVSEADLRINGGFFAFRHRVFDYIREGEELVEEPFRRLAAERQLLAYRYDGFWRCMDTFKDKQALEDLAARGAAPWQVWKR
jgi:glucose-1-phosphate cytidylyltransferase